MCPNNSVHHGCGRQGEAFWAQLISTLPPHGHRKSMLFSQNISEGAGGLAEKAVHTRAKITFLTHNQFPQLQQHVIRRGDWSKLVQRLVQHPRWSKDWSTLVQAPEVNLWAAMANNTKPGAYEMPNNTESRNTQCPMPGS